MKAFTVDGRGLDHLNMVELPEPALPGPDHVLVDVHAVSLNFRDLMVALGQYGGVADRSFVACSDMAGVVTQIGSQVTTLRVGDRVFNAPFRHWPAGTMRPEWARTFVGGAGVDGVLAEKITYPAESLAQVPTHMSLEQGSTLTVAGLTAWAAVVTHGHVLPGQWVLAHGTGGVSIFAAQIARMMGARTILTTSNKQKATLVKQQLGVEHTIDYRDNDWPTQVQQLTGKRGVDVVVEVAGGPSLARSVRACGYGARIAVIGVLAGIESSINIVDMLHHQITVRGIFMESVQELRAMAAAFEAHQLHPHIDRTFPFDDAPLAYEYLHSQQHIGKVGIAVRS